MITDLICCCHITTLFILLRIMLQPNLYPTVGLQTPGEIVEANFGRSPFVFDIEDYVQVTAVSVLHTHICCFDVSVVCLFMYHKYDCFQQRKLYFIK